MKLNLRIRDIHSGISSHKLFCLIPSIGINNVPYLTEDNIYPSNNIFIYILNKSIRFSVYKEKDISPSYKHIELRTPSIDIVIPNKLDFTKSYSFTIPNLKTVTYNYFFASISLFFFKKNVFKMYNYKEV